MRRVLLVGLALACGASVSVSACTTPEAFDELECRPDPYEVAPSCVLDAGADADASTDASGDASGPMAQANACTEAQGRCVPEPSSESGGDWTRTPVILLLGPVDEIQKTTCPPEVPFEKYRRYNTLVAPPAECEPCACEASTGECTELPAAIEIRTGACDQAGFETVPFDGPPGWDGSCSNEGGLAAGTMCNGAPCAQYVGASPLPGPKNESCARKSEMPAFTKETMWLTGGLACEADELEKTCKDTGYRCMRDPSYPWLHCVYRKGVHKQCPGNYTRSRITLYDDKPLDGRGCEACECGLPEGSACTGFLRLYDDAACSMPSSVVTLASTDDACGKILPAGRAIGAKAITDLAYVAGACAASGGNPTGSAIEDPNPETAVTFCCLEPFYDIP